MKKGGGGFWRETGSCDVKEHFFSSRCRHTERASKDNGTHGELDGLAAALKCTNKALLMCRNTAA